jgi:hypothetical protein
MILLVRIFGIYTWFKKFLIVITSLQVVSSLVLMVSSWLSVRPVQALWNPSITTWRMNPKVLLQEAYITGCKSTICSTLAPKENPFNSRTNDPEAFLALGDLCYVLLPVMLVWRLNMPLRQKVGLSVVLSLSLITMGCSIAKTVTALGVSDVSPDVWYKNSLGLLWSMTEQVFVIIMGCIPALCSVTKIKFPLVQSITTLIGRLLGSRGSEPRFGRHDRWAWSNGKRDVSRIRRQGNNCV